MKFLQKILHYVSSSVLQKIEVQQIIREGLDLIKKNVANIV